LILPAPWCLGWTSNMKRIMFAEIFGSERERERENLLWQYIIFKIDFLYFNL
jgi:hypothetical protein